MLSRSLIKLCPTSCEPDSIQDAFNSLIVAVNRIQLSSQSYLLLNLYLVARNLEPL